MFGATMLGMRMVPAVVAAAVLASAAPAGAADFAVTSPAARGDGSLRAAIDAANAAEGADRIVFDAPHVVEGDEPLPAVTGPTAIDGAGGRLRGADLRLEGRPVTVTRLGVEPPARILTADPPRPENLALHRGSDGRLRLTGRAPAGGALDLFREGGGLWLAQLPPLEPGAFSVELSGSEPPAGGTLTATATTGSGTSAFAEPAPISDLSSPVLEQARTVDSDGDTLGDVLRLTLSEPVSDASGLGGVGFEGPALRGATTGRAADDNELDLLLAAPLPGDAVPAVRVAANTTLTDPAGNQLLVGAVPVTARDEVAPRALEALAVSRSAVRVRFSEPVAGSRLSAAAFALSMSGTDRALAGATLAPDGRSARLQSGAPWEFGAAGRLQVAGGLTDAAGNALAAVGAPGLRVWAAPGDARRPRLTGVAISRRELCFVAVSERCRNQGAIISFTVDEPVSVGIAVRRKNSSAVSLERTTKPAGAGTIRIDSKIEGRRLRPGSYTVTVRATDPAGNASRAHIMRFRVRP